MLLAEVELLKQWAQVEKELVIIQDNKFLVTCPRSKLSWIYYIDEEMGFEQWDKLFFAILNATSKRGLRIVILPHKEFYEVRLIRIEQALALSKKHKHVAIALLDAYTQYLWFCQHNPDYDVWQN